MKYNILVTGCGGDIGQSVGKILKESDYVNELYGCDISDENAGVFIYENFFIVPRCNEPSYLNKLEVMVAELNIDFIVPIAEPELRFFASNIFTDHIGKAKLIRASDKATTVGFDKLKTAQFLKEEELPFPLTQIVDLVDDSKSYPAILKSRTGSGSSKIFVVNDDEDFSFYKKKNPGFIIQEFLDDAAGEFTCGVFRGGNGLTQTIILKRKLTGGFSGYGEVVDNSDIDQLLHKIAEKLELRGSINVQLRLSTKGPVVFEINPRFSSTVLFRHLMGFEDLIWSLEDHLNIGSIKYDNSSVGRKFYKGFNEYIL